MFDASYLMQDRKFITRRNAFRFSFVDVNDIKKRLAYFFDIFLVADDFCIDLIPIFGKITAAIKIQISADRNAFLFGCGYGRSGGRGLICWVGRSVRHFLFSEWCHPGEHAPTARLRPMSLRE